MAGLLRAAGERVVAIQASDAAEVLGANTIAELVALDATLRTATANRLMAEGVTIFRPETSVIDADVEVAADTVIEPFVQLLGRTKIGADCLIRSYSVIEDCTLGNGVLIRQSSCSGGEHGRRMGPRSVPSRTCGRAARSAKMRTWATLSRPRRRSWARAPRPTTSPTWATPRWARGPISAQESSPAITTAFTSTQTRIGKDAFVGSDSTLVAPVAVGDGAYVGAGSCITQDVPAGSLAVGRARQIVKEGWAAAQRARRQKG